MYGDKGAPNLDTRPLIALVANEMQTALTSLKPDAKVGLKVDAERLQRILRFIEVLHTFPGFTRWQQNVIKVRACALSNWHSIRRMGTSFQRELKAGRIGRKVGDFLINPNWVIPPKREV